MALCEICSKDQPVKETYKVYTSIVRSSRVLKKVSWPEKEYEVRTQHIGVQEHQYPVCESCFKRYNFTYQLIIWVPALLLMLYAIIDSFASQGESGLCIGAIAALVAAYFVTDNLFALDTKFVKRAVKERKKTDWKSLVADLPDMHAGYSSTQTGCELKGYTEEQYQKIQSS